MRARGDVLEQMHARTGPADLDQSPPALGAEHVGCEDVVAFVPGYFEESLPFVREHFALIWADVDLKLSMDSVLQWLMPRLHDEGAFFSDEVSAQCFAGSVLDPCAVSVALVSRNDK